ncbi:MAG: nitrous oxide reductase family maturation protein NosD, partial [Candidatus Hermodarchaeota archaeon]
MKSRKKTKNMVIAGFCIVLALSINICDQSKFNTEFCKDSRNNIKFTYSKLKLSKIVGTIHINNNWSEAKTAGLVTGSGTFSDPYVIEDLVIDGNFSGFCIWIENSSSYVRIENCTLYNSGSFSDKSWYWMDNIEYWWLGGGGIVLSNVSNSLVIGNNVSNNYRGILLKDSSNNTLSGNSVNNNDSYGIDLILSGNNTLSGNILNNHGLLIFGSQEQLSTLKITTNNLVNGKFIYYYVNEIDLKPYNFSNAGQVYLVNCSNSNISNLNVSSSTIGITLFYSNNNTISGSTSNNNFLGIGLINSSYNNITKNIANYNTMTGIALISSNNNSISGNTANNNSWIGINLVESNFNSIFGNIANNNTQNGLASTDSDNNKISGNIISYNGGNGLFFISNFDKNTITGNNVSHNEGHGLWLSSECNNNNISDNNIRSNEG